MKDVDGRFFFLGVSCTRGGRRWTSMEEKIRWYRRHLYRVLARTESLRVIAAVWRELDCANAARAEWQKVKRQKRFDISAYSIYCK